MDGCLFCGIVAGTIPSKTVYKDEKVTAFWDIDPKTAGPHPFDPKRPCHLHQRP